MKNWTVREAVKVIREGKDQEAIKEIVKHFPLFAVIVASKDFDGLAAAMPDHVTVRKIENELNSDNAGVDDTDTEDEGTEDSSDDQDLSTMSTKELIALCGKRGIKVPKYGKNKQFYLDALSGNSDSDGDGDDQEDEEEDDPIALYKKCKKAGLKVQPKKSAKYYKDALKKAEQEADEAECEEDEDWDEDDEEEEKPAKKANNKSSAKSGSNGKGSGKAKSKAKAKTEPEEEDQDDDEEDDEDNWDI